PILCFATEPCEGTDPDRIQSGYRAFSLNRGRGAVMALDWRDTLQTLVGQFEARAKRLPGLHHLMVEVADDERDKMTGPGWFTPFSNDISIVGGKPQFRKWDMTASRGLPGISPSFREPKSGETFEDSQTDGVIRDKSGVVRAVAVPMKLRRGYLCGQPSEEASGFEFLANVL